MDPEMVWQQQQAEREALHALPKAEGAAVQARVGRASLFSAAQRLAQPDPESWSLMTGQFERIVRMPFSAANLMAGFGMVAAQYMDFLTQMAGAMAFAPANFFVVSRGFTPLGMAASMPWWPRA